MLSDGKAQEISVVDQQKTVYQLLFEMNVNICDRFGCLSPFDVRRKPAREVFLIVKRLNEYNRLNKKNHSNTGKKIIRRPAGDNWF